MSTQQPNPTPNPYNLTKRDASAAANALNNTGIVQQLLRSFCRDTLGRPFYELHAPSGSITLEDFAHLTMQQIGVPQALSPDAVKAAMQTAAGRELDPDASVIAEDFAGFALYSLFKNGTANGQIERAEIWTEIFEENEK